MYMIGVGGSDGVSDFLMEKHRFSVIYARERKKERN